VLVRSLLISSLGLALLVGGCAKREGPQSKEAVQAGIERYLQKQSKIALSNMTL